MGQCVTKKGRVQVFPRNGATAGVAKASYLHMPMKLTCSRTWNLLSARSAAVIYPRASLDEQPNDPQMPSRRRQLEWKLSGKLVGSGGSQDARGPAPVGVCGAEAITPGTVLEQATDRGQGGGLLPTRGLTGSAEQRVPPWIALHHEAGIRGDGGFESVLQT